MSTLSQPGVVSVCNEALALVGAQRINTPDEQSMAAAACKDRYADAVRATLRDHTWVSACARVNLAPLAEKPVGGQGNLFRLPADFVRVVSIDPARYEINGRLVTADAPSLALRYVSSAVPASEWDPLLRRAVAMQLAAAIAPRFGIENRQQMLGLYRDALAAARHASASERLAETPAEEDWIGVRGGFDDQLARGSAADAEPFGPFAGDLGGAS